MSKRREFSKPVYVEIVRRATDSSGTVRCEECHGACVRYEVDHVKPDGLEVDKSAKLTAKEGRLLCAPCHKEKTAGDVAAIARAKRREVRHLGARVEPVRKIPQPPPTISERTAKNRAREVKPSLPPRPLFRDNHG